MRVGKQWRVQDTGRTLDGDAVGLVVRSRIARGELETWFESDSGRLLALVTDGQRALVIVLRHVGDAGEHLIDRSEDHATSSGYVLSNGQVDTYPNRDTIPLAMALDVVRAVIQDRKHPDAEWQVDR
jgi:hypothetical protein